MENPALPLRVATAGEALIDLIGRKDGLFAPCLGGSVFNFTRAMARQGVGVLYLNPLSTDRFGRQLAQALVDDGVQLAQPQAVTQPTSLAVVGLGVQGQPDYAFYREGVADRAVTLAELCNAVASHGTLDVVCSGCLALAPDDAQVYLPFLSRCWHAGKTVVIDANLRPSVMPDTAAYRAHVQAVLQYATIIKVSDEDLAHLDVPGLDPMARAWHLLHHSMAHGLLLTLGGEGACLLMRDGRFWRAKELSPVTVVDTVGAGDCFLAGFMCALLAQGFTLPSSLPDLSSASARACLRHALASATLCVQRLGCEPPDHAEVFAWSHAHPAHIDDGHAQPD